jgi:hypothetical protein
VPDVPQALLHDPRMRAPQMASMRASLARSLQAGIGNRAVGAMLMRDPAAAPPAPAVEHQTGKAVDDALSASPYFAKLVEARFTAGTKADGHVHVQPEADFVEAYVKMATALIRPSTGKPYSEAAARTLAKNAAAFEAKGEIYINAAHGDPGTVVHESMHLFSGEFLSQTAKNVSEGVTEHFTKVLCVEMSIPRGEHYKDQLDHAQKLIPLVGEDTLAAAYFQNKVPELEVAVDAKKGSGTFRQWVAAMKDGKYAEADALL